MCYLLVIEYRDMRMYGTNQTARQGVEEVLTQKVEMKSTKGTRERGWMDGWMEWKMR